MGLDMYLNGRKFLYSTGYYKAPVEDGFQIKEKTLELGYWRKEPDLHGYIVQTFADGVDDCAPISLTTEHMRKIIEAILADKLPHTEGFFFGKSARSDAESEEERRWAAEFKEEAVEIFTKAIAWVEDESVLRGEIKSVEYRASW
jgi:hypothetical protein